MAKRSKGVKDRELPLAKRPVYPCPSPVLSITIARSVVGLLFLPTHFVLVIHVCPFSYSPLRAIITVPSTTRLVLPPPLPYCSYASGVANTLTALGPITLPDRIALCLRSSAEATTQSVLTPPSWLWQQSGDNPN